MEHFDKAYDDLSTTERSDFIDLVAQAVLDKLEERNQLNAMVDDIIARIYELQQPEQSIDSASVVNKLSDSSASLLKAT